MEVNERHCRKFLKYALKHENWKTKTLVGLAPMRQLHALTDREALAKMVDEVLRLHTREDRRLLVEGISLAAAMKLNGERIP